MGTMHRLFGGLAWCLLAAGCASQPTSLTAPSAGASPLDTITAAGSAFAIGAPREVPTTLGACLQAPSNPNCFSGSASRVRSSAAGVSGAAGPLNLTSTVSNTTVSLSWSPPAGGGASSYIIEAGSASGRVDLASLNTNGTATSYVATGVPPGTYFVRARAVTAAGVSDPSNEVTVIVQSTVCQAVGIPGGLTISSNSGGTVTFTWSAAPGAPTSYVLQAGSTSGQTNLANSDLGGMALSYTARSVPAGTYYVRVLAKNACGLGTASNEVVLVVSPTQTSTVPGPPRNFKYVVSKTSGGLDFVVSWDPPDSGGPTTYYVSEISTGPDFRPGQVEYEHSGGDLGTFFHETCSFSRSDCPPSLLDVGYWRLRAGTGRVPASSGIYVPDLAFVGPPSNVVHVVIPSWPLTSTPLKAVPGWPRFWFVPR
jgi:hypothetical protein